MPQRSGCSLRMSFLCLAVGELPIPPSAASRQACSARLATVTCHQPNRRASRARSAEQQRRTPTQHCRCHACASCTEPARRRPPCAVAPGAASDGARLCVHAPVLRTSTGLLSARASDAQRLLLCAGCSRRRAIADVSGELCLRYSHLPANDPPLQAPWLLPPSVRPMRTEDVSRRGLGER